MSQSHQWDNCLGLFSLMQLHLPPSTSHIPLELAPGFRAPLHFTAVPVGLFQMDLHQEPQPLPRAFTEANDIRPSQERTRDALANGRAVPGSPTVKGSLPSPLGHCLPSFRLFSVSSNTLMGLLFPFPALHLNVPELRWVVPTRINGLNTQPGTDAQGN